MEKKSLLLALLWLFTSCTTLGTASFRAIWLVAALFALLLGLFLLVAILVIIFLSLGVVVVFDDSKVIFES